LLYLAARGRAKTHSAISVRRIVRVAMPVRFIDRRRCEIIKKVKDIPAFLLYDFCKAPV
jgi:hypothetical protein